MNNMLIWGISLWLWTASRRHMVAGECFENKATCEWISWQPWGECSSSCGGGTQTRQRAACCETDDIDHCVQNCDAITYDGFYDQRCCAADCSNGGTFQTSGDSCDGSCHCPTGYSGRCCEQYVCDTSAPCSNNGVCVPVSGTEFNCECNVGFTGERCETNIDECSSNPCQNEGTCVDGVNGYMCTCVLGYTDQHCEIYVCDIASPCSNNGVCVPVSGTEFNCACNIGFTGGHCETNIDECSSDPCQNGGTCVDGVNGYICACELGYTDQHCEIYVCDNSALCSNNGVCVPVSGTEFNCECNVGFSDEHCETNIDECTSDPCQNGGTCVDEVIGYRCTCVPGYTDLHCETDIDECESSPCRNGGNCTDYVNRYICKCSLGFTGSNCETDIDECASNPCKNGATCRNMIARFYCQCASGWYDVLCDRDACRPVPADVLFIVDSSISMTEQEFKKQLEFIKNFTDGIKVGPQDFQVSIITFSFEAKIEFYLNKYTTNATLKTAIDRIQYVPGPTYTNKALDLAKEVFSASNGAGPQTFGEGLEDDRRNPEGIVYLLTDGMSTQRDETKLKAKELKKVVNRIITIGIGPQVSHQELFDIATESTTSSDTNVFSVSNFDALFTLVKRLVKLDCKECSHSAASDVTLFVDTSGSLTRAQFHASLEAMKYFVSQVPLGPDVNDTHVEAFTFDSAVHRKFDFLEHNDTNQLQNALQSIDFVGTEKANFSEVMKIMNTGTFTQSNYARNETARRFMVIFTNGKIDLEEKQKFEAEKAKLQDRVTIIAIGTGEGVSVEGLLGLATDPYHVFYIDIDPDDTRTDAINMDSLKALQNEFAYNTCDLSEN